MAKKLDELIEKAAKAKSKKKKKKPSRRMIRKCADDKSDCLDVEIIRRWVPHLVACDFNRFRSLRMAFPQETMSDGQCRQMAQRLIKNEAFTEIIGAHLDSLESELAGSERYVLNKLYRQSEANIFDYFDADEHGRLKVKDLKSLPRHVQQNVKKIKVRSTSRDIGFERTVVEQEVELEIVDTLRPVALLGKNLGMFIEKVEVEFGKDTANRLQTALQRVRDRRIEHQGVGSR